MDRLEQAFIQELGARAAAKTCKAMEGLFKKRSERIALDAPDAIRDCALIGAAQRVEHYGIAASYGTVRAMVKTLAKPKSGS